MIEQYLRIKKEHQDSLLFHGKGLSGYGVYDGVHRDVEVPSLITSFIGI